MRKFIEKETSDIIDFICKNGYVLEEASLIYGVTDEDMDDPCGREPEPLYAVHATMQIKIKKPLSDKHYYICINGNTYANKCDLNFDKDYEIFFEYSDSDLYCCEDLEDWLYHSEDDTLSDINQLLIHLGTSIHNASKDLLKEYYPRIKVTSEYA